MEYSGIIPAEIDDNLEIFKKVISTPYIEGSGISGNLSSNDTSNSSNLKGGSKSYQRVFFKDKDYLLLNRSANVLIYMFSEAIKEINDTEYTPNNINFKPNQKQTFIINLLKRFKEYVENYTKYSLPELKSKLNRLNNEFLNSLNKETQEILFKKVVYKIYEIRDKVVPKNQDFKKLFETIYPTISNDEADELNKKIVKPIQNVINSIKVIQPIQPGLSPLKIKGDKKPKLSKTLMNPSIIKSFTFSKLDDKTIDIFKNAFINNDMKLENYCEIDKKNILDFNKLLDNYTSKLEEYNKAKTDNDKSFVQGQIQHYKNELTKTYLELQPLIKYISFYTKIIKDKDKILKVLETMKAHLFNTDDLNDVSKLHIDSNDLRELEEYAPLYNNYVDDFKKLTVAEQNFIKNDVFNIKSIFDDEINTADLDKFRKDEIKAYVSFYLDDFKYVFSLLNNKDEAYSILKIDKNPETVKTKSGIIKKQWEEVKDQDIETNIKQYLLISLYFQALESDLVWIKDNSLINTPLNEIYDNETVKLLIKGYGLNEDSSYYDIVNFIQIRGDKVLKKYEELSAQYRHQLEFEKKQAEMDQILDDAEEEDKKLMEEIDEQLKDLSPIIDILKKENPTKEDTKKLMDFYRLKFENLKQVRGWSRLSKGKKKEYKELFMKKFKELTEQYEPLKKIYGEDELPYSFDDVELSDESINAADDEENDDIMDGHGTFKKKKINIFDGGAIFDNIKGNNKDKISIIERIYKLLKDILEEDLDIKLDDKLPDLSIIIMNNDKEDNIIKVKDEEEKKGGNLDNLYEVGITSHKLTKEKNLPFNPPSKSIEETNKMIKEKKNIRNMRINNFNRTKIRTSLNDLNTSGLYQSLNEINPEFLKNLAGNGTFLKDNINHHLNYIKNKAMKLNNQF